jgi:hypothetical protein
MFDTPDLTPLLGICAAILFLIFVPLSTWGLEAKIKIIQ